MGNGTGAGQLLGWACSPLLLLPSPFPKLSLSPELHPSSPELAGALMQELGEFFQKDSGAHTGASPCTSTSFHAGNPPARTELSNVPLACSRIREGNSLSKAYLRRNQQDSPQTPPPQERFNSCASSGSDKRSRDFARNKNQVQEQVPAP